MYLAEERIRQAMDRGEFDHLPGEGKPLRLVEYPFEAPECRLAHHILRNAGYTLPWIEVRKDLLADIDEARGSWMSLCEAIQTPEQQSRIIRKIKFEIEQLNQRIRSYNLQAELVQSQLPCLQIQIELERLNVTNTIS